MTRFGNWLLLATGFAILAIVGTLTNGTSKALAESDTFTTIDFPGASFTAAQGINPRGDIVGNYIAGVTHGYLLSGGEFTSIDFPGASFTCARAINPRGDIVGAHVSAGVVHGYLLSEGSSLRLISLALAVLVRSGSTLAAISWDFTSVPV